MSLENATFTQIYTRYVKDVFRFAYWMCGDADDAKDITSETFVRLWTSDGETHFDTVKGYLLTIAKNLCLQHLRKKKRHIGITEENAGNNPSLDREIEGQSELQEVLRAMETLPEVDRTLLLMRAEGGLSLEEIATACGLTVGAVKVRIFRARARLSSKRSM